MYRWIYYILLSSFCISTIAFAHMSNLPLGTPPQQSASSKLSSQSSSKPRRVKYKTIVAVKKKNKKNASEKSQVKRGKRGKPGKKGKRGPKGDPGQGIQGFVSAVHPHTASNIRQGETIKSMLSLAHNQIYYDTMTGLFTSEVGPGFYEIHFGGSWSPQSSLVLIVDGNEVNPCPNAPNLPTWSRETLIVHATSPKPTFALGNAKNAPSPMSLVISGSNSAAFITIKKIG